MSLSRISSEDQEKIFSFATDGKFGKLQELLDELKAKGIDLKEAVNVRNAKGITPLMAAAAEGHVKAARLLLDNGADVNAKDNKGNAALSMAVFKGHIKACQLLLRRNANIDTQDNGGSTPLMLAVRTNKLDIARFLVKRHANVQLVSNEGWTAHMFLQEITSNESEAKKTYGESGYEDIVKFRKQLVKMENGAYASGALPYDELLKAQGFVLQNRLKIHIGGAVGIYTYEGSDETIKAQIAALAGGEGKPFVMKTPVITEKHGAKMDEYVRMLRHEHQMNARLGASTQSADELYVPRVFALSIGTGDNKVDAICIEGLYADKEHTNAESLDEYFEKAGKIHRKMVDDLAAKAAADAAASTSDQPEDEAMGAEDSEHDEPGSSDSDLDDEPALSNTAENEPEASDNEESKPLSSDSDDENKQQGTTSEDIDVNEVNVPEIKDTLPDLTNALYAKINIDAIIDTMHKSHEQLHRAAIMHGDVAGRNFMLKLTDDGKIISVAIDLGLANQLDIVNPGAKVINDHQFKRTPVTFYDMAGKAGEKSLYTDLYAFRLTIIELITKYAGKDNYGVNVSLKIPEQGLDDSAYLAGTLKNLRDDIPYHPLKNTLEKWIAQFEPYILNMPDPKAPENINKNLNDILIEDRAKLEACLSSVYLQEMMAERAKVAEQKEREKAASSVKVTVPEVRISEPTQEKIAEMAEQNRQVMERTKSQAKNPRFSRKSVVVSRSVVVQPPVMTVNDNLVALEDAAKKHKKPGIFSFLTDAQPVTTVKMTSATTATTATVMQAMQQSAASSLKNSASTVPTAPTHTADKRTRRQGGDFTQPRSTLASTDPTSSHATPPVQVSPPLSISLKDSANAVSLKSSARQPIVNTDLSAQQYVACWDKIIDNIKHYEGTKSKSAFGLRDKLSEVAGIKLGLPQLLQDIRDILVSTKAPDVKKSEIKEAVSRKMKDIETQNLETQTLMKQCAKGDLFLQDYVNKKFPQPIKRQDSKPGFNKS